MRKRSCITVSVAISIMISFLFTSCSQPATASPGPASPTPPTAGGEGFTIVQFLPSWFLEEAENRDYFGYLQKLLNEKGWAVELKAEPALENAGGEMLTVQSIKKAAAAGNAADAYVVSGEDAEVLLNTGFTQNLARVVPEAAPELYDRYRRFFGRAVAGLPLAVSHHPKGYPLAVYLKKDHALAGEATAPTIGDVMSMLEGDADAKIGAGTGLALMDAWAGEMGYYPLAPYGISGGFYARSDDRQCAPVAIEDILGFGDFAARAGGLARQGKIVNSAQMAAAGIVGYIGPLGPMDGAYLAGRQETGAGYLAYPLAGCGMPVLPQNEPAAAYELAVSAGSGKAGQVAGFVEWALTGREGYDLIRYGAEGVDYRLTGGRLEYLNNGTPLTVRDWGDPLSSAAYCFHGSGSALFSDDTMGRVTVYSPWNADTITESVQPARHPIWGIENLRGDPVVCEKAFSDIAYKYESLISQRLQCLGRLLPGVADDTGAGGGTDYTALLTGISFDTRLLGNDYYDRIRHLIVDQSD